MSNKSKKKSKAKKQPAKKSDKKLFIIIAAAAVIIIAAAIVTTVIVKNHKTDGADTENTVVTASDGTVLPDSVVNSTVTEDGAYELYEGVYLISLDSYSGKFVEDGTDTDVTDIMQATIVNTTNTAYIRGEFRLTVSGTDYDFAFTTLFPNSTMTVLDQNKTRYTKNISITGCEIVDESFSVFTYTPSVHLDTFGITYTDNAVNVENKTDKDISGVYVYYKNIDENGVFQGGITYRVSLGDIPAGETVQGTSQHLSQADSKICFVTWDGMTDE